MSIDLDKYAHARVCEYVSVSVSVYVHVCVGTLCAESSSPSVMTCTEKSAARLEYGAVALISLRRLLGCVTSLPVILPGGSSSVPFAFKGYQESCLAAQPS